MGKKSGGVRIKQVGGMKPPISKAALASLMAPPKMEDFMIPPEEMISIPTPPPNYKKYQIFFPIFETFTMQTDTFQMIYPIYIDPTKTIHQGRRVPIHLLTTTNDDDTKNKIELIDDQIEGEDDGDINNDDDKVQQILLSPTVQEISQVLQNMNIRHVTQPYKCYSRTANLYDNPGRCLVDIKSSSSSYKNKYTLLIEIAKQIHLLPIRQQRIEQERILRIERQGKLLQLQAATAVAAIEGQPQGTVVATTTSSNKKKGNKKKK